ncbi:MAG: FecR domain-containing protein [Gemmatimonadota bacterium]|nr:FecR domain-containing protein [Gemmatimonadota bacterium]
MGRHRRHDERDPRRRFPGLEGMELTALRRYVTGESARDERRRIEQWATASPERREYLAAMRRLCARAAPGERAEADGAWRSLLGRMEPPEAGQAPAPATVWEPPVVEVNVGSQRRARGVRVLHGGFSRPHSPWAAMASLAATILLAAAGVRVLGGAKAPTVAAPTMMRSIATSRGQRAQIQLDDGTQVVLGVDSRLRFASDFGAEARNVYLDGTAYFHVAHDDRKPFTVHTANAVTRDVGTRFVVRAYPADGSTAVVVTEGSVALEAPDTATARAAVLTRDELGVLADGQSRATVSAVDPARYTAWMRGRLVFRDTPLGDVVRELGRWYDVDVELGDPSLAAVPFSASFAVETVREAIATITTVLPLRAARRGPVVTLFRR